MNREQDLSDMERAMVERGRMAAPMAALDVLLTDAEQRLTALIEQELQAAPVALVEYAVSTRSRLARVQNDLIHLRKRIRDLDASEFRVPKAKAQAADDATRGALVMAANAAADDLPFDP